MIENPKQFQEILDSTDQKGERFADWLRSAHLKTLQEVYRHQIDTEAVSLITIKDLNNDLRGVKERSILGLTLFTGRLTSMLSWLVKKATEPTEPNRKYNRD